jgi:pyrophosphatase PpaX
MNSAYLRKNWLSEHILYKRSGARRQKYFSEKSLPDCNGTGNQVFSINGIGGNSVGHWQTARSVGIDSICEFARIIGMLAYSTILFDFDGTLTPSLPLWVQAFQYALEKYGIRMESTDVVSNCFYRSWDEIASSFQIPSVSDFRAHIHDGLDEAFIDAQLFDDAAEVLEQCRQNNIQLGIVTSGRRKVVQHFLKTHGLTDHFGAVVTADDVEHHKPHPAPVFMALSQLKSGTENCILIGDSQADLQAAEAAKIHKGLFYPSEHNIFYRIEELTFHRPHLVFHAYCELLQN